MFLHHCYSSPPNRSASLNYGGDHSFIRYLTRALHCPISPLWSLSLIFVSTLTSAFAMAIAQHPLTQGTAVAFCGPWVCGHSFSTVSALAPLPPHPTRYFPLLLTCVPLALLFVLHLSSVPGHFLLHTVYLYFNHVGGLRRLDHFTI